MLRVGTGQTEDVVVEVGDVVVDEDVPGHTGGHTGGHTTGICDFNITSGLEMTDSQTKSRLSDG